jgi:hypothetical protein
MQNNEDPEEIKKSIDLIRSDQQREASVKNQKILNHNSKGVKGTYRKGFKDLPALDASIQYPEQAELL